MPGLLKPTLQATLQFSLRNDELDYDPSIHLKVSKARPSREYTIPITDLRSELEAPEQTPPAAQLDNRGFAVVTYPSTTIADAKDTAEGIAAYLEESRLMMQELLGAKSVHVWNSVWRINEGEGKYPDDDQTQTAPVPGRVPVTDKSPTSGNAHVDQDDINGARICRASAGDELFEQAERVQIVNLWRPIHVVTNKPLAYCDFRSTGLDDTSSHTGPFGGAYTMHHSPKQQWNYIQKQTPNEAVLLRCYDSFQGKDGQALFAGHCAVSVLNEDEYDGEDRPRESIEIRFVVLH